MVGVSNQATPRFELRYAGNRYIVHGQVIDSFKGLNALRFYQAGCRTLLPSLHHMLACIGRLPHPCQKTIAFANSTAVRLQMAMHQSAQPLCGLFGRVQMQHQKDSASALATT